MSFICYWKNSEKTIANDRSVAMQELMTGGAGHNADTKQPERGAVSFDSSLRLSLSLPACRLGFHLSAFLYHIF